MSYKKAKFTSYQIYFPVVSIMFCSPDLAFIAVF